MPGLGPTCHDFSLLGLHTEQLPGIFAPHRQVKAPVMQAYILLALARLACEKRPATFLELFCADGHYAMFARRFGAAQAVGIDSDRDGYLASAEAMRSRLGLTGVEFRKRDVRTVGCDERFDIVANVGGLYHLEDPVAVLDWSYRIAARFLMVQTVGSMATDAPDYFETPAPGLPHGSRHSRASFDRVIRGRGWRIVDSNCAALEANARLEDRGALFYLIEKPRDGTAEGT
ncbi:MAG: methyltransferase domain-containing protein [Burkholderiales bacterium]